MSWGYKIFLVIVLFITGMLTMVFIAFKQTNEMIDSNYYDKEIHYQAKIDAANKLNLASEDTIITFLNSQMLITIPKTLISNFEHGQIEFIKNDEMKYDQTIAFVPDSNGTAFLSLSKFKHGMYKARIAWMNDKIDYYREQNIFVP